MTTFRVLVANRGEIAVRIVRACHDVGFEAVVVHSDVDADGLAVRLADRTVCIGPADASRSYRAVETLVTVAVATGCDAVHPGYGFLAENARFAGAVVDAGLRFIGPSAEDIEAMGDKIAAREAAARLGVPVVPGVTLDGEPTPEEALAAAQEVGFPVLIKAAAGGGGKGIRPVLRAADFPGAFAEAGAEALAVFGSSALYLERYVRAARHVEVQVFGDGRGGVVTLGERDCSVQRRHQKLIEEAPSPVLSPTTRSALVEAARALASDIGYAGAGTVEFLYDLDTDEFHFIEMNTRIQVEHPVTEVVHGIDLVAAQLWFAATGEVLVQEADPQPGWHALECRINAEDPRTLRPTPGRITHLELPGGPGVRVDTHCTSGYRITPYYDSMIAKIIAWGSTRPAAVARMRRALTELRIDGPATTAALHLAVLASPEFAESRHTTTWLEGSGILDAPEHPEGTP